jgi:hypothetical protein
LSPAAGFRTTGTVIVTLAAAGVIALPGCGGDDEQTVDTVTLPEQVTTSEPATTSEPQTTEATTTGESGGVEAEPDDDSGQGEDGGTGGTGSYDPSKPDSPTNDVPPQPSSPQEKFEQFCDENPQACG